MGPDEKTYQDGIDVRRFGPIIDHQSHLYPGSLQLRADRQDHQMPFAIRSDGVSRLRLIGLGSPVVQSRGGCSGIRAHVNRLWSKRRLLNQAAARWQDHLRLIERCHRTYPPNFRFGGWLRCARSATSLSQGRLKKQMQRECNLLVMMHLVSDFQRGTKQKLLWQFALQNIPFARETGSRHL